MIKQLRHLQQLFKICALVNSFYVSVTLYELPSASMTKDTRVPIPGCAARIK